MKYIEDLIKKTEGPTNDLIKQMIKEEFEIVKQEPKVVKRELKDKD